LSLRTWKIFFVADPTAVARLHIGAPFEQKQIEPAGAFYELLLDRIANVGQEAINRENPAEADAVADETENDEEAKKYGQHKKKKFNRHSEDLYELLGLEHLRWQATQDDIKRACMLTFYHCLMRSRSFNSARKRDMIFSFFLFWLRFRLT
jgi:hypothetical protein